MTYSELSPTQLIGDTKSIKCNFETCKNSVNLVIKQFEISKILRERYKFKVDLCSFSEKFYPNNSNTHILNRHATKKECDQRRHLVNIFHFLILH